MARIVRRILGDISLNEYGDFQLRDGNSYWFRGRAGSGRVLRHLLRHAGKKVSLEKIAEISGWNHTERRMAHFGMLFNIWSRTYRVARIDERVDYGSRQRTYYMIAEGKSNVQCEIPARKNSTARIFIY